MVLRVMVRFILERDTLWVRDKGGETAGVHHAVLSLVCFPSSHGLRFLTNPFVMGSVLCTFSQQILGVSPVPALLKRHGIHQ